MADEEVFGDDYYDDVLDEVDEEDILPETPEIRDQLDELDREVTGPPIEEMTDEELHESIEGINEDTLEFLRVKEKSKDKKEAQRAKLQLQIYDDMTELMDDVKDWVETGEFEKAEKRTIKFLDKVEKRLKKADVEDEQIDFVLKEIQDLMNLYGQMVEQTQDRPGLIMRTLSGGLDLLPVIGSGKMILEGYTGRTLAGEKLSLGSRFWTIVEGTGWMVFDILIGTGAVGSGAVSAGAGGVAVEGGGILAGAAGKLGLKFLLRSGEKSILKMPKVLRRAGAALRSIKGVGKGSEAMIKAGKFLVSHPRLLEGEGKAVKAGQAIKKLDTARDVLKAGAAVAKAPIDWAKRASIIRRYQEERQELMAALSQI